MEKPIKVPLMWHQCQFCKTIADVPRYLTGLQSSCFSRCTRCSGCCKYLKFLSKMLLTEAQIADFCAKAGIKQKQDEVIHGDA